MKVDQGNAAANAAAMSGAAGTEKLEKQAKTGAGVTGAGGAIPSVAAGYTAILSGLQAFVPQIGGGDFEVRLAEITAKLKEVSSEVNTGRVLNEQETKRLNMKENQAKISESEKKLEEAEAKKKSASIWDKISLAFEFIGAALMGLIGAALLFVPGLQAAGALMLVGAGLMLLGAINTLVQQETGAGLIGNLAKAIDPNISDEALMAIEIGFAVTLAVATIAVSVASGRVDVAAAKFAHLGKAAADVAVKAAQLTLKTATAASTAIGAVTGAGAATSTAVAAGVRVDAAETSALAAELQADSKDIEAFMQQLDDLIDQALAMMMEASERFNGMLDDLTDMNSDTGDVMSRMQF
jgi:F0F1-type ATP synthase assembly protein I